jgi:3-hydroxyacyl-[acyl-carrier-protein] dehydratase
MVDKILEVEPGRRLVACKTFPEQEELFQDHFPGFPVVPGVLVTETMVQSGGWLILCSIGFTKWPFLCMLEKAKFRKFARPGQELRVEATLCSQRDTDFEVQAEVLVGEERVAEARIVYHTGGTSLPAFMPRADELRATFQRLSGTVLL